jgi:hypothetical protein
MATEQQKAVARRAGALRKVEKLPKGRLPRKVRGLVESMRSGPWEHIEVRRQPLLDGFIFHITAQRYRGSLVGVTLQTSVFYSKGGRGRLGKVHKWSAVGNDFEKRGWWWAHTWAERG